MDFPDSISFTITNTCNLRCKMCGQWSEEGYMHGEKGRQTSKMELADWKRLVDEVAANNISSILLRGGEPFLFPGIMELIEYINSKGIFISIDSNGTMLKEYAKDLLRFGNIHITFSVDGPEEIHDQVRGMKGCFNKIKENVALLYELEKNSDKKISKSITFTISPYSYKGLGQMPEVARSMSMETLTIVPYYYVPESAGKEYEKIMQEEFGCKAFSWHGFHHNSSEIDVGIFKEQYRQYLEELRGMFCFPYMELSESEYETWFSDHLTPVGSAHCSNVERQVDIQPNGDVNFCTDFPDYIIGNVKESTIKELWDSERAARFREYRRKNRLPVCFRCGAKYMAEVQDKV